jgi:hypothetical protein
MTKKTTKSGDPIVEWQIAKKAGTKPPSWRVVRAAIQREKRQLRQYFLRENRETRRLHCGCLWKRGRLDCSTVSDGVVVECRRCEATWLLKRWSNEELRADHASKISARDAEGSAGS